MKGVLDRFESNGKAVILIEEINKEIIVSEQSLPPGSKKNTWFHMKDENGTFKIVSIDIQKTEIETKKSSQLMNKLRSKSRGSKFKRK